MKKSKMSKTASQYFSESGEYTGYKGPKSNAGPYAKPHPIHGSVTRDYSTKPGVSIGAAVNSLGKMKRRMKEY